MKIAFDVKGTLDGPKGDVILKALRHLQELGHECTIWSNLYSYAACYALKNRLEVETMSKLAKYEIIERGMDMFDVCVEDDRSQTYLGANNFVFVDDIDDLDSLIKIIVGYSK